MQEPYDAASQRRQLAEWIETELGTRNDWNDAAKSHTVEERETLAAALRAELPESRRDSDEAVAVAPAGRDPRDLITVITSRLRAARREAGQP